MSTNDTICAIATASGPGGISVLRISGPQSWQVAGAIFQPQHGSLPQSPPTRRMLYGHIVNGNEVVDEVLTVYFRSPYSYTTEDTVEIQGHGGPAVMGRIMELALDQGCRPALAGEFTQRAYLGGRLDLAAAEAVAQLVAANSQVEARLALSALAGGIAQRLRPIRESVTLAGAAVEAAVDFPDEAPEIIGPQLSQSLTQDAITPLKELLADRARRGAFMDGGTVVICGRPNAGKSSLFNRLLGSQRAIVTAQAGTTRDSLAEGALLGGVACRLIDTAGLGQASNELDRLAQGSARQAIGSAHLALVMLDGSVALQAEDLEVIKLCADMPCIIVQGKSDLEAASQPELGGLSSVLRLSSLSGQGIDQLCQAIGQKLTGGAPEPQPGEVMVSLRQGLALQRCLEAVIQAKLGLDASDLQPELVSLDIAEALEALGEADGQDASDGVIDAVFENFCVGK